MGSKQLSVQMLLFITTEWVKSHEYFNIHFFLFVDVEGIYYWNKLEIQLTRLEQILRTFYPYSSGLFHWTHCGPVTP